MPRKTITLIWIALLAALVLAVACGGGGDDDNGGQTGQLSDPQNVPTATEWAQAPDIILLDPNNIQPLPTDRPVNAETGTPTPEAGEPGVCGDTYTVVDSDTMFGIADKCGVSADDLQNANPDVDPRSLHVGDVLIIPQSSGDTTQ